ncbi:hypothetical protein [Cognatiyoonia sp. IB215182]|nr:hypothetical protein [Cognatiyoonia sp. IB215182]MDX8355798.1 hypothetical protein [Cognatiyoonia sp. IB215182]
MGVPDSAQIEEQGGHHPEQFIGVDRFLLNRRLIADALDADEEGFRH